MSDPPDNQIIVFSTVWCHYCHALMDWLDDSKIPYIEYDTETVDGLKKAEELLGGDPDTVPTSIINGQIVVGFDRQAILKLLKK